MNEIHLRSENCMMYIKKTAKFIPGLGFNVETV